MRHSVTKAHSSQSKTGLWRTGKKKNKNLPEASPYTFLDSSYKKLWRKTSREQGEDDAWASWQSGRGHGIPYLLVIVSGTAQLLEGDKVPNFPNDINNQWLVRGEKEEAIRQHKGYGKAPQSWPPGPSQRRSGHRTTLACRSLASLPSPPPSRACRSSAASSISSGETDMLPQQNWL